MKRTLALATALLMALLLTLPAQASYAEVVEGVESVVATAPGDNDFGVLLATMQCTFVKRVVHDDGSWTETQHCLITGPFLDFGPEYAGGIPETTFVDSEGPCIWTSDYWINTTGEIFVASDYTSVAFPSGRVWVKSHFDAEPLTGEDCGF